MQYDYELDGMKLSRWNPKTEKTTRIPGLFGNAEAAKRVALVDFQRMSNLAKTEISCRFTANGGPWEKIQNNA